MQDDLFKETECPADRARLASLLCKSNTGFAPPRGRLLLQGCIGTLIIFHPLNRQLMSRREERWCQYAACETVEAGGPCVSPG